MPSLKGDHSNHRSILYLLRKICIIEKTTNYHLWVLKQDAHEIYLYHLSIHFFHLNRICFT